jgi:hypothetical protein
VNKITTTQHLVPAYGRDYKSAAAVTADFLAGKDFDIGGGHYCSVSDFASGVIVNLRYAAKTRVTLVRIP